jgi:hypothetical protein
LRRILARWGRPATLGERKLEIVKPAPIGHCVEFLLRAGSSTSTPTEMRKRRISMPSKKGEKK